MSAIAETAEDVKSRIIGLVKEIKKSEYFLNLEGSVMIEYCDIFDRFGREMIIVFSAPANNGATRSFRNGNYQPTIVVYSELTTKDRFIITALLLSILEKFSLRFLDSREYNDRVECRLTLSCN